MTPKDLREHIEERIEFNRKLCETLGREPQDTDTVMTLVGSSMKGLPVRPMTLATQLNPVTGKLERIYSFSLKQCRKLLDELDKAE